MPCILALVAFLFPRLVIILLALFSHYLSVYSSAIWPILGFFFLPYTTLAYAWAKQGHGSVEGVQLVVVIIAVLVDLGVLGGGAKARSRTVVRVRPS